MISFDFDYYRPTAIDEAVNIFRRLKEEGKEPIYYAGGTEIISLARLEQVTFGAAIDIKEIPECNVLEFQNDKLVIGAAVTLTRISETGMFPMLGEVCKAAADHTARDKITIGGNICGMTPYRETVLPFLISDSDVVIASTSGVQSVPINQVFDQSLRLAEGDLLVQLVVDKSYTVSPYVSQKRTKHGKVGYPLATIASLNKDNRIRVALSGVCAYPFRLQTVEDELNDGNVPFDRRIGNAISHLPSPILSDMRGSAEYRELILENMFSDILAALGGSEEC